MPEIYTSIVQSDCTACGLCPDTVPEIFYMAGDGLAYVRPEGTAKPSKPELHDVVGRVAVSTIILNRVIEAAEECPGVTLPIQSTHCLKYKGSKIMSCVEHK
jgi:ferredoxin